MAASYNLNEVLKAKEAAEQNKKSVENEEIHLDDVSRVKVLSPGRQVFKRFIRNRLAVFGSVVLIFMFAFSFLGPLFYAHGQTEIFYKYNNQNVNYALAKENSAYNGYVVNDAVELDSKVVTAMNSNIKSMIEEGKDYLLVEGETGNFEINRLGDEIYTLSGREMDEVCTAGTSTVTIGTYDSVGKKLKFSSFLCFIRALRTGHLPSITCVKSYNIRFSRPIKRSKFLSPISVSMRTTFGPYIASAEPMLAVEVVLPTPPFWLHIAMTLHFSMAILLTIHFVFRICYDDIDCIAVDNLIIKEAVHKHLTCILIGIGEDSDFKKFF